MRLRIAQTVGLASVAVIAIFLGVCRARNAYELARFRRSFPTTCDGDCRVLSSSFFEDNGDYSGCVRFSGVLVIVGEEESLTAFAGRIARSVPKGYVVERSGLTRFTEAARRGYEDPEDCLVVQVSNVRSIEPQDAGHWLD